MWSKNQKVYIRFVIKLPRDIDVFCTHLERLTKTPYLRECDPNSRPFYFPSSRVSRRVSFLYETFVGRLKITGVGKCGSNTHSTNSQFIVLTSTEKTFEKWRKFYVINNRSHRIGI